MKRVLAVILGLIFCLLPALAQQQDSDSPKKSDKEQKAKKEDKPAAQKPAEAPATTSESKAEPAKDGDDKEVRFDVSEVAPEVTHHQITVEGKALKYTSAAYELVALRGAGRHAA